MTTSYSLMRLTVEQAIMGPVFSEAICCFNFRQAGESVQQRAQRSSKIFVKTAVSEQSH